MIAGVILVDLPASKRKRIRQKNSNTRRGERKGGGRHIHRISKGEEKSPHHGRAANQMGKTGHETLDCQTNPRKSLEGKLLPHPVPDRIRHVYIIKLFFECSKWVDGSRRLYVGRVARDNIIAVMSGRKGHWYKVASFV